MGNVKKELNMNKVWQDRKHFMWFPWSFTKYSIENGRLVIRSGLFNSSVEETLLYRIVDISMRQTLLGKVFGTGDIIVKAKVDSTPEIILKNISNPDGIRCLISEVVENSRTNQKVVGKEFYGGDDGAVDASMDGDFDCDEI